MSAPSSPQLEATELSRRERHRQLAEQLQKWSREDPEYDERVGALLATELPLNRFRLRSENTDDPAS